MMSEENTQLIKSMESETCWNMFGIKTRLITYLNYFNAINLHKFSSTPRLLLKIS